MNLGFCVEFKKERKPWLFIFTFTMIQICLLLQKIHKHHGKNTLVTELQKNDMLQIFLWITSTFFIH